MYKLKISIRCRFKYLVLPHFPLRVNIICPSKIGGFNSLAIEVYAVTPTQSFSCFGTYAKLTIKQLPRIHRSHRYNQYVCIIRDIIQNLCNIEKPLEKYFAPYHWVHVWSVPFSRGLILDTMSGPFI